jgi:type III secretion system (T3SS) SseB-like protein
MAGTWGKWEGSWERSREQEGDGGEQVAAAAAEDDPVAMAKWLFARDFTLIDEGHESQDGSTAALVLEIDDHPVVVAFTSLKFANRFASEQPELFDDPQNIKGFVVTGQNLILNLPSGGGVLINPATDEEKNLSPELVEQIRVELNRSA